MDSPVTAQCALLQVLLEGPGYGTELAERVSERTKEGVKLLQGSIYPALGKFQDKKLVKSYSSSEGSGRPRVYYALTEKGRALAKEQRAILVGLVSPSGKPKKNRAA